jgi:hypothetical protein
MILSLYLGKERLCLPPKEYLEENINHRGMTNYVHSSIKI